MFLEKTQRKNAPLLEFAFQAHRQGVILPDTYLIDVDAFLENAAMMKRAARQAGVELYFMLKQLGRNPVLARLLTDIGFGTAVAVDFREALGYVAQGIPLGNVGHLVQTPTAALERILRARPEIVTVYSVEKAQQISDTAGALGVTQDIMLRVVEQGDQLYSGQSGGFCMSGLEDASRRLKALRHVRVAGVCAFPCFHYCAERGDIVAAPNATTVMRAAAQLTALGHEIAQRNMPSASCARTMQLIAEAGGTHAEPGHGLTGTTPWHAAHDGERPALVYLTEVSHNFGGKGFCYGGGHYRRSHMARALTGPSPQHAKVVSAAPPDDDSIDYHFTLDAPGRVGDPVVMAFRTQIFVTRSHLALVEGLSSNAPKIAGLFDAQGMRVEMR